MNHFVYPIGFSRRDQAMYRLFCVLQPRYHDAARKHLGSAYSATTNRYADAISMGANWDEVVKIGPDLAMVNQYYRQKEQRKHLILYAKGQLYYYRVNRVVDMLLWVGLVVSFLLAIT